MSSKPSNKQIRYSIGTILSGDCKCHDCRTSDKTVTYVFKVLEVRPDSDYLVSRLCIDENDDTVYYDGDTIESIGSLEDFTHFKQGIYSTAKFDLLMHLSLDDE